MRTVRLSITFNDQLNELLDYGEPIYGAALVEEKKRAVFHTIKNILAHYPAAKKPNAKLGLTVYAVTKTPFILLYDFDDAELRVHFIFHHRASLKNLDPTSADW